MEVAGIGTIQMLKKPDHDMFETYASKKSTPLDLDLGAANFDFITMPFGTFCTTLALAFEH